MRVVITPMSVYNKPYSARIMSYLCIFDLVVGISLIITSTTVDKIEQLGFIAGGAFVMVAGLALGALSMQSCRTVQSVKYIMMPCCMNEAERKLLEEQAIARTPMLNVMLPVVMAQQQVNYQQQIGYQTQVQPMIIQNTPIQNAPQQFVNQQQNVAESAQRQVPSAITAPQEIMSVM
ncbi:Hypothetical_protein [Hexamita inflata]|uniref:Hypothetical_protein n=1 Tax=Hexamita inflata TaxID=28002 RepID=A0AA86VTL0_9EUKA|nr:Hypothetical protein HINF_LOCUS65133 [Hexamita inflata]